MTENYAISFCVSIIFIDPCKHSNKETRRFIHFSLDQMGLINLSHSKIFPCFKFFLDYKKKCTTIIGNVFCCFLLNFSTTSLFQTRKKNNVDFSSILKMLTSSSMSFEELNDSDTIWRQFCSEKYYDSSSSDLSTDYHQTRM